MYDKVIHIQNGAAENVAGAGKEMSKLIDLYLTKKDHHVIVFDSNLNIVNSLLAVFVIQGGPGRQNPLSVLHHKALPCGSRVC
jgi:hypothetical protein